MAKNNSNKKLVCKFGTMNYCSFGQLRQLVGLGKQSNWRWQEKHNGLHGRHSFEDWEK